MLEKIKAFRWGYILLFLAMAAVGACFLMFYETLPTLALVIGIILIIYGIFSAVIAISDKKRGGRYASRIIISVICIICGTVTAVLRENSVNILSSLIGLFLVIDGSFKINTAAMSRRYKLLSWWLMVIPASLVILGGFLSLKFGDIFTGLDSDDAMRWLSAIIGVTMIVDAIGNLLSAFYVGGFEKKLVREIRHEIDLENEKKALEAATAEALPAPETEAQTPEAEKPASETPEAEKFASEMPASEMPEAGEASADDATCETVPADEASKDAASDDETSDEVTADTDATEAPAEDASDNTDASDDSDKKKIEKKKKRVGDEK
ncbi:MAG: DUF308 domain-containing protein [Clostridia bacterium]|nr:DUF308 domain-containing protein [Clostridia bacterium]